MHSVAIEHMAAADRQKDQFLELLATANLNKSRLLAAASHDLHRPLQTLALLNGTLRRLARDPDIASAVAQQEQALNAVSRLLNALLDISKLESGAIKPEPTDFNIGPLFADLQRDFADLAATEGLDLQVSQPRRPCTAILRWSTPMALAAEKTSAHFTRAARL